MFDLLEEDFIYNYDISISLTPGPEIVSLNSHLEGLTIDINTQELQVKVEKVKRQKLLV